MSINITPNTNNSYVNYVNYTKTPVAFRASNSAPQTKPMSTETKCLIGGGVVVGAAALVIGAKKGLFGQSVKNKINELFKKFGGDAKAKVEQEAKLKAEQEAKAKAEKEAQERAATTSSQSNKPNNNTGSATTSSSSSSSGSSNSGSSSSTRHISGRRNSDGHSGSSRSTNNSTGSSSNVNSTNTAAKPNGNRQTLQPNPQNNAAKPNTNPQPTVPPKTPVTPQPKPQTGTAKPNTNTQPTVLPKPQSAKPEPKPKTPTAQPKPKPEPAAVQPKPQVTQPPKEILDKINEINAVYADALKEQLISFIKTFENGEVVTTASVKTEQLIETMLSEVPANVPETIKQELKTALEKELEKLKLVRTGKVDDEKILEEFNSKASDFFENIDNNPALSSIKNKIEQWGNQVQQDTNRILQNIERNTAEAKEAQRKIDIAQAVHTAQGGFRLSGKSAEESAEVFSEAMSKENRNAKRMMQNLYDEAVVGRLEYIDSKEQATKYLMQKIEKYVQDCGTFKKVNKNVEINGERVNIIYEGIDVDITSEGKLLKKVFVSKPQKAPEMQYENLSKRLSEQVEADAEYASRQAQRQAQRQRQAQQQRRMLHA